MNEKTTKELRSMIISIVIGLVLGTGLITVQAWTEPTGDAPTGDLGAPINTSIDDQTKTGAFTTDDFLRTNGRTVYWQDAYIYGDNASALSFYSNSGVVSQLLMRNSAETAYGRLYGSTGGTGVSNFGLVNTDGQWSYQDADDVATYFYRNGSIKMTILENGLVGIGTTSPAYSLDVVGGGHFTTNLTVDGTARAAEFMYSSDERLKNNINSLQNVKDILNVSPVTFDWKDSGKSDTGVIAQEVEKYFPEFVKAGENGFRVVNYPKLVVPLIGVVKEQQQKIDELEKRLEALENK